MLNRIKLWVIAQFTGSYKRKVIAMAVTAVVGYLVTLGVAPETAESFGDGLSHVLDALTSIAIVSLGQ